MDAAMESVETVDECVLSVFRVTRSSPWSVEVLDGRMIRSSRIIDENPGEPTVLFRRVQEHRQPLQALGRLAHRLSAGRFESKID